MERGASVHVLIFLGTWVRLGKVSKTASGPHTMLHRAVRRVGIIVTASILYACSTASPHAQSTNRSIRTPIACYPISQLGNCLQFGATNAITILRRGTRVRVVMRRDECSLVRLRSGVRCVVPSSTLSRLLR